MSNEFAPLGLDNRLIKRLDVLGFTQPTEIQQQAIPYGLSGRDLLASSKTGSGKTLAFLLPAIHRVLRTKPLSPNDPRVLILLPTRELARQVFNELKRLLDKLSLQCVPVIGGENFNDQCKALRKRPHFVVGTPGRVQDHLKDRSLFLQGLELLILDEADRMLDLGFAADINAINDAANHRKRQTLMFSATLENAPVHTLTKKVLKEPKKIEVGQATERHGDIEHSAMLCDNLVHKEALLQHILATEPFEQAIIFTATRDDSERLATLLNDKYGAKGLSGKLTQSERNNIMQDVKNRQCRVLVCTDVASRGLDVLTLSLVINFDLPKHAEEYIHRIGRTGRAGQQGKAVSLVGPKDWLSFVNINALLNEPVPITSVEGMEAKFKGLSEKNSRAAGSKAASKGKRGVKGNSPWDGALAKAKKTRTDKRPEAGRTQVSGADVGAMPVKRKKRSTPETSDDD